MPLIFFLILIATSLVIFNYRKTSLIVLGIILAIFLIIGYGVLFNILADWFENPYMQPSKFIWKQQNAIVVLGSGTIKLARINIVKPTILSYSRLYKTAEVYHLCKIESSSKKCKIIISGGDVQHTGISEAAAYQNALIAIGINKADIILEPKSMNTYKNAEFTSTILKNNHFDNIYLITSGLHIKRALLFFSHFGIFPTFVPSDYIKPVISIFPNSYNFVFTDLALHEWMGILEFYLYNYFGWNNTKSS
jgi:uncharacterized SAM-binding protein YcdF (DUF218 family)